MEMEDHMAAICRAGKFRAYSTLTDNAHANSQLPTSRHRAMSVSRLDSQIIALDTLWM